MKRERIDFKLSSKATSILITVTGLLLYVVSLFINAEGSKTWVIFAKKILETIGPTIISVGCVSLVLEISTIQKCVEAAISDLVKGEFPMESYSPAVIEKMRMKAVEAKCAGRMKFKDINDTVYGLEPYLFNEIRDAYYESHTCKYVVVPESDKIVKKVYLNGTMRNDHNQENLFRFSWSFKEREGVTLENLTRDCIKIKKFIVNREDYTNEAKKRFKISKSDNPYEKYPFNVSFSWDFSDYKRVEFEFDYEYYVEPDDMAQAFKLMRPCKKFYHEVYIDGKDADKWELSVNAFAAFNSNGHPLKKYYSTDVMTSRACKILFDTWALPGAGYVVTFVKK